MMVLGKVDNPFLILVTMKVLLGKFATVVRRMKLAHMSALSRRLLKHSTDSRRFQETPNKTTSSSQQETPLTIG